MTKSPDSNDGMLYMVGTLLAIGTQTKGGAVIVKSNIMK